MKLAGKLPGGTREGSAPAADAGDTPGRRRLVMAALFLGTLLLFWRAVGCDFVNYDDPDYVTANEHVRAGLSGAGARWATWNLNISYWHPLTWLSHMLDWQLYGDKPAGHHATSVLWHAVNAVLVFAALRRLTGALGTSAVAAALFAWHPLRVESVAWVAERKDVLSGFFGLATIWSYASYAQRRASGLQTPSPETPDAASARQTPYMPYAAALVLFAGGLMSKPMLVSLPVVLLVLDFWPLRRVGRESWRALLVEKVPFLVLSIAVGLLTMAAQRQVGTLTDLLPLGARLSNAAVAVARYLGKFCWPVDLAVLYPHPGFWPAASVVASVALLVALSALAWWQRGRRPWLLAGWLWFLIALLPASGVLAQVGIQAMADRYTYLPMLGVELALLWSVADAVTSPGARQAWAWGAAVALVALAARTWQQLGVWRNSLTLFEHTVAVAPAGNYLAYNNRGMARFGAGRIDEALADYRRALEILPGYANANNNLGHALEELGRSAEAIPHLRAAVAAKPDLLEAHNNLANALSSAGQVDEALQEYALVLARQPGHVNALVGSAAALGMKGDLAGAQARLEAALRVAPGNTSALGNLGIVCAMSGRREEAVGHFRRALAAKPDDPGTLFNLGMVLNEMGRWAEAAEPLRSAVQRAPGNAEAHAALGTALVRLGRRDEARAHLRRALELRPGLAAAQAALQQLEDGK